MEAGARVPDGDGPAGTGTTTGEGVVGLELNGRAVVVGLEVTGVDGLEVTILTLEDLQDLPYFAVSEAE